MIFIFFILPFLMLGILYYALIEWCIGHYTNVFSPLKYASILSAAVTAGFVIWGIFSIETSRSSTAGIGMLFLMPYACGCAAVTLTAFWLVITGIYKIFNLLKKENNQCGKK